MFPPAFARKHILALTKPGGIVCDPFSGRGTTLLEALLNDRHALAADINPVAWCVSAAKAKPARLSQVRDRLCTLKKSFVHAEAKWMGDAAASLPAFFHHAFHPNTLKQLLFLKRRLRLRDKVDRFIAAVLLGHLHGELDRSEFYLSNQMPHTISTKPDYSVRYWKRHLCQAPDRDVWDVLLNRSEFRLMDGIPQVTGTAALSDVRQIHRTFKRHIQSVDAVITSPPYLDVTRFEEDQWLRLWFLGGPASPHYGYISRDDRHCGVESYWSFLAEAWRSIALLLKPFGYLVCRIGTGRIDVDELEEGIIDSVREAWPKAYLVNEPEITVITNRQTTRMNADAPGCKYEVDFTFVCP